MARKNTVKGQSNDSTALRDEWLTRLAALMNLVKGWAEELDWSTRVISKKMKDSRLGSYEAPALIMQKETTRVLLDPVARFAPRTEGVVDLYLMPAYDDIASLYFVGGKWRLHYMFNSDQPAGTTKDGDAGPLSKKALTQVLDEMTAHATESL